MALHADSDPCQIKPYPLVSLLVAFLMGLWPFLLNTALFPMRHSLADGYCGYGPLLLPMCGPLCTPLDLLIPLCLGFIWHYFFVLFVFIFFLAFSYDFGLTIVKINRI